MTECINEPRMPLKQVKSCGVTRGTSLQLSPHDYFKSPGGEICRAPPEADFILLGGPIWKICYIINV